MSWKIYDLGNLIPKFPFPSRQAHKDLKNTSYILLVFLLFLGQQSFANGNNGSNKGSDNENEEAKGTAVIESAEAQEATSMEEVGEVVNDELPEEATEKQTSGDASLNTISRYNYLFYFIYKYKYESKVNGFEDLKGIPAN